MFGTCYCWVKPDALNAADSGLAQCMVRMGLLEQKGSSIEDGPLESMYLVFLPACQPDEGNMEAIRVSAVVCM